VFTKGAGSGKVWTSNANGTGSWQTINTTGVSQQTLDDSITTVRGLIPDTFTFATKTALTDTAAALRSIRKVDTLWKSGDSIIYSINGLRYALKSDSVSTFSFSKNAAKDSMIANHNGVRYAVKDSIGIGTVTSVAAGYGLSGGTITSSGTLIADTANLVTKSFLTDRAYLQTSPTLTLSKNTTRDSIVTTYNGVRSAVKDSSIAVPILTFAKSSSRDSMVLTYNGTRTAVKDSLGGSTGWGLTGNAGTSGSFPGTNFIGTTDNQNINFKRNNIWVGAFYSDGLKVGESPNKVGFIEVQGNTTGSQATGTSFLGYGNFQTYSTNNYGFVHFNGSSKYMGIGVGTDGITRIATGTSSGIAPAIYINAAYGGNGNVGIGGSPVTSAKLAVTSTSSGFLPPVMTSTQRDAIATPDTGLMIFCSDCTATDASTGVTQTYNGSTWKNFW
jgi:hypothetical protein